MSATRSLNSTASSLPGTLAISRSRELSSGQWKLASTTARGQRARVVSVQAREPSPSVWGDRSRLAVSAFRRAAHWSTPARPDATASVGWSLLHHPWVSIM